jgi:hypothetical protein
VNVPATVKVWTAEAVPKQDEKLVKFSVLVIVPEPPAYTIGEIISLLVNVAFGNSLVKFLVAAFAKLRNKKNCTKIKMYFLKLEVDNIIKNNYCFALKQNLLINKK